MYIPPHLCNPPELVNTSPRRDGKIGEELSSNRQGNWNGLKGMEATRVRIRIDERLLDDSVDAFGDEVAEESKCHKTARYCTAVSIHPHVFPQASILPTLQSSSSPTQNSLPESTVRKDEEEGKKVEGTDG